ncbi:MAG TPA: terminase family protein, partial [bacterium]|nr:terminase family protein [bacterium]
MLKGLTKEQINEALIDLPDSAIEQLMYDWQIWARDNQKLPEGDWLTWLIIAGRGWGKTRTGAETIRQWQSEGVMRMALVGQTPAEVRDVMIEGESGILAVSPPWNKPVYKSTQSKVCWNNGAVAHVYSAENPEVLRGPQHEKAWIDELAKFRYAQDIWDNMMFGLRLGDNPQVIITTTPRPTKTLKSIMTNKTTVITKGTTYE